MVKLPKFLSQFKDKYWQIVLSPNKLSLFYGNQTHRGSKIYKVAEITDSFVLPDRFLSENFRNALQTLVKRHQTNEIGVCLSLSNFFTRSFTLPSLKTGDIREVITLKIQNEMPIALERYHWSIQKLYIPTETEKFLVVFYQREIIEAINQILLNHRILPLVIEPSFLSLLRYLQTKLSFVVDGSYIIIVFSNSILLSIIYENNQIQNAFAELIKTQDSEIEQFLKRTISFLITKLTKPLQDIFVITDTPLIMPAEYKSKIINLNELTNNTVEEMFAIGLAERMHHFLENLDDLNFNLINPLQEYTLSRLRNIAVFWTVLVLAVGLLTNIFLFSFNQNLQLVNNRIKQTFQLSRAEFNPEQFKREIKTFVVSVDQLMSQNQSLLPPVLTKILNSGLNRDLTEVSLTNKTVKFKFKTNNADVAELIGKIKSTLTNASLSQSQEGNIIFIEAQVPR
jgi:hypothetical protein